MKYAITVVIPTRNEDLLEWTIAGAVVTAGAPIRVIAITDGDTREYRLPDYWPHGSRVTLVRNAAQRGNCACRDQGIELAGQGPVLLLDAHMSFREIGWAAPLADWSAGHPTALTCFIMVSLRRDNMRPHCPTHSRYYGCRTPYSDRDSQGKYNCFPVKWGCSDEHKASLQAGKPTETQTILGGAYLLDAGHYLTTLRRPWQHSLGWGTSEQTVSLPNSMLGHRNYVYPMEVGHCYRDGVKARVPYASSLWHLYYNQRRLIEMLPLPADTRGRLLDHHHRNDGRILNRLDRAAIERAIAARTWEKYGTESDWQEYAEKWRLAWWSD